MQSMKRGDHMSINFAELFEEYWANGGHYQVVNNVKRTYDNLHKALISCESVRDIDDYVCELRTRKESTRKIIVDFLQFVEDKTDREMGSLLFNKRFYDDPVERQLEMAKYLHEPKCASDIEEHFEITSETRKKDLQALREGIEILGGKITLEEQREGRKIFYKSTVHPVFLPLNLTEIYALVKYLPNQLDLYDPNSTVVMDIIKRIKAQLSDYAWERIYPGERKPTYDNEYISDRKLAQSRKGIQMYLMKSGKECSFFWNGKEYRGRITIDNRIQLIDGSYLDADLSEVDFIIDSFEYG